MTNILCIQPDRALTIEWQVWDTCINNRVHSHVELLPVIFCPGICPTQLTYFRLSSSAFTLVGNSTYIRRGMFGKPLPVIANRMLVITNWNRVLTLVYRRRKKGVVYCPWVNKSFLFFTTCTSPISGSKRFNVIASWCLQKQASTGV